jgi:hypothetical protein
MAVDVGRRRRKIAWGDWGEAGMLALAYEHPLSKQTVQIRQAVRVARDQPSSGSVGALSWSAGASCRAGRSGIRSSGAGRAIVPGRRGPERARPHARSWGFRRSRRCSCEWARLAEHGHQPSASGTGAKATQTPSDGGRPVRGPRHRDTRCPARPLAAPGGLAASGAMPVSPQWRYSGRGLGRESRLSSGALQTR